MNLIALLDQIFHLGSAKATLSKSFLIVIALYAKTIQLLRIIIGQINLIHTSSLH